MKRCGLSLEEGGEAGGAGGGRHLGTDERGRGGARAIAAAGGAAAADGQGTRGPPTLLHRPSLRPAVHPRLLARAACRRQLIN